MAKGVNLATHDFKKELVKLINDSGLPIVNVRYILIELTNEIIKIEEQAIQEEGQAFERELEEEKKKAIAKNKLKEGGK